MAQRRNKKYTRIDSATFKKLVREFGTNVKKLSEMSRQSERQVRRNLEKLRNGKAIGDRGYGKARSLSGNDCYTFMRMKYVGISANEIKDELNLSDSKFRRIVKLITIPDSVLQSDGYMAVHMTCEATQFYIVWCLRDNKISFSQFFGGNRVNDDGLCDKLMRIISSRYFDSIEGRKIKLMEENEKYEYYLKYFSQLTTQFESIYLLGENADIDVESGISSESDSDSSEIESCSDSEVEALPKPFESFQLIEEVEVERNDSFQNYLDLLENNLHSIEELDENLLDLDK